MKLDITIITGFLGAGKSTFLTRILKMAQFQSASVIINEMGEESLDHLLVETVNEDVFPISAGCICCSSHSALNEALCSKLAGWKKLAPHKVFIETSGVTDAVSLLSHINAEPALSGNFRAQSLCLVSSIDFTEDLLSGSEFSNQIASADQLLITKGELISEYERDKKLAHIASAIGSQFPQVEIAPMPIEDSQISALLNQSMYTEKTGTQYESISKNAHDFGYKTLKIDRALEDSELTGFLEMLQYKFGNSLFRVKGIALSATDITRPKVIQLVGTSEIQFHWLDSWSTQPGTAITVIYRDDKKHPVLKTGEQIERLFASWFNLPTPDEADRAGLTENPLSVTGLGAFNPHSLHPSEPD